MKTFEKFWLEGPYIAHEPVTGKRKLPVYDKYSGELLDEIFLAGHEEWEKAVERSVKAFHTFRHSSAEFRAGILEMLRDGIAKRKDAFAVLIAREAGKPLEYARNEVRRAIDNLETGIRETLNFKGEMVPMDYLNGKGKTAYTLRVPYGPVLGISPFNFPLNLALHKIIPAVGSGSPVLLKPALQTPLSMLAVARILREAGVPEGIVQIVPAPNEVAETGVKDSRFAILSFTGSDRVGWYLKDISRQKKVFLEAGGNAAALIDENASLKRAAKKLAYGSFLYAGQICISTQRIFVLRPVFDEFTELFLKEIKKIESGNPLVETVTNGPMISGEALKRIDSWVREARQQGAGILTGGKILDNEHKIYAPTVLTDTNNGMKVMFEEVFAPLVNINPVESWEEGVAAVNDSRYGLQAAFFTDSLSHVQYAVKHADAGGVMINEIPGFRIDGMPYGGMKDSGLGREGARYALREYTQEKLVVIND